MSLDVNLSEPEEFNCNELHSSIEVAAKLKGIHNFEYHVDYVCGKGENFIANVFRVTIKETENVDKNVKVIVKTLVNTTRQELFHELHKREVNVYNDVISKFIVIQKSLEDEDRIELPECIFSRSEKGNEVIILEDLKNKGFELDDTLMKYENLDFDRVSSIISQLAKFHALSLVYEIQYADDYNKIKSQFTDLLFEDGFLNRSKLRNYFFESYEISIKLVTDLEAKKKLLKVQHNLLEGLRFYMKPDKRSVMCHGDCWMNNMMFKHEDSKHPKVCFLDFQATRYANPVTDIIYFMYICTDSAFRSEHFEQLQTIYYDSLKSFLNLFNIDSNIVYPEDEYKKNLQENLPFGLLIALIELRIVAISPENEAILKGSNIIPGLSLTEVTGEVDLFKIKINDVVDESVRNGVLDMLIDKINDFK